MLSKFSIVVSFLESGKIRGRGGEAVYGFLLNEVAKVSKEYADFLHNTNGIKPFVTSPLMQLRSPCGGAMVKDGILTVREDTTARITISTLVERATAVFMKAMIDAHKRKKGIDIGGIRAEIERVSIKESEGARYTTFSDILKKKRRKKEAVFKLLTPLSFRHNGRQITFPSPELVFASLLKTWNAFSNVKIPEETEEIFGRIAVSRYDLHTELWNFSRYKIFGCRGKITYNFDKGFSNDEIKILNALCELGNFSGVGYKRTMGMGMVDVRFG